MPTYRYECQGCGHGFELFQSMTARLKRKCPECGERRLERLIGAGAGIIFKGSGFYETDYRSTSYTEGEKAAKKEPAGSTSPAGDSDSSSGSGGSSGSGSSSDSPRKAGETAGGKSRKTE